MTGVPGRWQVSTKSGIFPAWTKDGSELLFESNGAIMAVSVDTQGAFRASQPAMLFALPLPVLGPLTRTWNCSADGQRFLLLVPPRTASRGGIEVVTDVSRLVHHR